jgi:hypothetical protein
MMIPDEFAIPALKKQVTAVIMTPIQRRGMRNSALQRLTLESHPRAGAGRGSKKYAIIGIDDATSKKIKDLKDDDVKKAGHKSLDAFLSWWTLKHTSYHPDDKVVIVDFEIIAIERWGHKLLKHKTGE